jgi:hypothetical protein
MEQDSKIRVTQKLLLNDSSAARVDPNAIDSLILITNLFFPGKARLNSLIKAAELT